jgi:hypothetical protein
MGISSQNVNANSALTSQKCNIDTRFTDSKARDWCMNSHPRLANTLLSSNNNSHDFNIANVNSGSSTNNSTKTLHEVI